MNSPPSNSIRRLRLGVFAVPNGGISHKGRMASKQPDQGLVGGLPPSHRFVVIAFAAFLVARKRRSFMEMRLAPSWSGLLIVAGSLMLLLAGTLGSEYFLTRSSFLSGASIIRITAAAGNRRRHFSIARSVRAALILPSLGSQAFFKAASHPPTNTWPALPALIFHSFQSAVACRRRSLRSHAPWPQP